MSNRRTEPQNGISGDEIGRKLLQALKEMKAGAAARVTSPLPNVVAAARARTGLSQTEFAEALRISVRTIQEWEQGRRVPSGAALSLIELVHAHPDWVTEARREAH